jgi:hypothetical protein
VAERLAPYETVGSLDAVEQPDDDVLELMERGMTLLLVMPVQKRETVEDLLSPNDHEKGRRAVDALIESAFAAEDESGRLRRL